MKIIQLFITSTDHGCPVILLRQSGDKYDIPVRCFARQDDPDLWVEDLQSTVETLLGHKIGLAIMAYCKYTELISHYTSGNNEIFAYLANLPFEHIHIDPNKHRGLIWFTEIEVMTIKELSSNDRETIRKCFAKLK